MWRLSCSINPKRFPDGVPSSVSSVKKGSGGGGKGKRRVFFSLRCRMGVIKGRVKDVVYCMFILDTRGFILEYVTKFRSVTSLLLKKKKKDCNNFNDDGPYSKGNKDCAANDSSTVSKRRSIPDEIRGLTTVELIKREGSSLGLTISGGSDKDGKPRVSNLRPGGLAARSDQLNMGDYIKSVNGINLSKLRHDEIISMLKNIGERVVLEVEYELPPLAPSSPSSVISKTIEVCLEKEGNSFGFVLRGGFHEDWHKARPLVVTYVRPGGPADREGTLRVGDRVLSVNGVALNRRKHADALTLLMQSSQEAYFLIEYDITVMESVQQSSGPLQVDITKSAGSVLGLILTTALYRNKHVITIQKIKPASVAERCGALHVGDILLAIDGISTEHCSLMEAQQLLANSSEVTKLEILPSSHSLHDTVRIQRSSQRQWDSGVNYLSAPAPTHSKAPSTWSNTTPTHSHCTSVASGNSSQTSGFQSVKGGSVYPSPYPCSTLPSYPSSPRSGTTRRKPRRAEHKSSLSLSSTVGVGGQVVHVENNEVVLRGDALTGFGLQLQGGVFATEPLSAPACIRFIEPDSPAERCGVLQVGDRILSINGISTDDGTLEEANQLLRDAALSNQVTLDVEFDVAEVHSALSRVDPRKSAGPDGIPGRVLRTCLQRAFTDIFNLSLAQATVPTCLKTTAIIPVPKHSSAECLNDFSPVAFTPIVMKCFEKLVLSHLIVPRHISNNFIKYADDTTVVGRFSNNDESAYRKEIQSLSAWCSMYNLTLNATKTKELIVDFRKSNSSRNAPIYINGSEVDRLSSSWSSRSLRTASALASEHLNSESVIPSSGTFHVKLPKRRGVEVGITISASKKPGRPLIISEIKRGSIAHRTGTLEPGDRLLGIDNVKLENCGIDEAMAVLQQAEDMVKLRIQKDEDNLDELESSGSVIFTVELKRHGGPLGITISGTEEPFNPILISSLTRNGLAHRTGALHVGDRVLAINHVSLKGKPLSEAIHLLQTAGDAVTLKIKKRTELVFESDSGSPVRAGSCLSDTEDDRSDSLRRCKHSGLHQLATPPSMDSAMDSWDGSALDAGYGSQGACIHRTSDLTISPNEWRRTNQKSPLASRKHTHRAAVHDGKSGEDDWKYQGSVSPMRCRGNSDSRETYWSQALQDLETCGQSEILRELEATMMSDSTLSLGDESEVCNDSEIKLPPLELKQCWNCSTDTELNDSNTSAMPLELHKICVLKDEDSRDFGFSVSDGLLEKGVYVNMIRPDGPADRAGLQPYDRILQVNHVRTRDFDCCLAVPLIAESGDQLQLVISRNPVTPTPQWSPEDSQDSSDALPVVSVNSSKKTELRPEMVPVSGGLL
ncbi:hypothetical protein QTP86_023272 [Hemibagrus guttatus]|nr:hypothetical protein QTP86_023272 [Hemibagrus guttatus]